MNLLHSVTNYCETAPPPGPDKLPSTGSPKAPSSQNPPSLEPARLHLPTTRSPTGWPQALSLSLPHRVPRPQHLCRWEVKKNATPYIRPNIKDLWKYLFSRKPPTLALLGTFSAPTHGAGPRWAWASPTTMEKALVFPNHSQHDSQHTGS